MANFNFDIDEISYNFIRFSGEFTGGDSAFKGVRGVRIQAVDNLTDKKIEKHFEGDGDGDSTFFESIKFTGLSESTTYIILITLYYTQEKEISTGTKHYTTYMASYEVTTLTRPDPVGEVGKLKFVSSTPDSITLSFDKIGNATDYIFYYQVTDGPIRQAYASGGTQITIKRLQEKTLYYFSYMGYNDLYESDISEVISAKTRSNIKGYSIYIGNSNGGWDQYIAYIGTGNGWVPCYLDIGQGDDGWTTI